jgi:hypothetical protein
MPSCRSHFYSPPDNDGGSALPWHALPQQRRASSEAQTIEKLARICTPMCWIGAMRLLF